MTTEAVVGKWYVSCYETIGLTCPYCGEDVCKQFEKVPTKCDKCGTIFSLVIYARKGEE